MARELIEKEIDGATYSFSQFGAKQGVKTLLKIGKMIGEPMALAFGSFSGEGPLLERKIDGNMLGMAAKALFSRADDNEVLELITLLAATSCQCDGKQIDFNSHYEGRYGHMFKVLQAAIEVQYGNFFDALTDLGATTPTDKPPIFNRANQT